MVLVDTSVWIRGLAGKPPWVAGLDRLLDRNEVAGHELIYGELLVGDSGGRRKFLSHYETIHYAESAPHAAVVAFARERRLQGRGIGWIDVHLLASALIGNLQIWTADAHLSELANEFGIAYTSRPFTSHGFQQ